MKNILIISTIIIILLFTKGCTSKQDKDNLSINDNSVISDSIFNEEFGKKDKLTLLDLKNLLETSNSIEVKDLENQVIGQIVTGENISKTIEDIFSYNVVDSYEDFSKEDVVATISFHINGDYPVYGLIKEQSIYMEGYYFISNRNSIKGVVKDFEISTKAEPIAID